MLRKMTYMASAAMMTIAAVPANAATFLFDLSGSRSATFTIDTDSPKAFANSSFVGEQFGFNNVAGTFAGAAGIASIVSFGSGGIAALNIQAPGLGFTQFAGGPLFTGTAANPMFNTGTFTLNSIVSGRSTLTISAVAGAVPEPSTWAMMIMGFGMIGGAMRYSRRKTTVAYA